MKIHISVARQLLTVFDDAGMLLREYSVSTGKAGVGEMFGSFQTPRGRHRIRAKIGAGAPENTIFVRRRPTGEIWSADHDRNHPGRDWILTRILWLSGCEVGRNCLGKVDTMRRFIYIHGSPERAEMGRPGSHGCIRMRNADIIELFDLVPVYSVVEITED